MHLVKFASRRLPEVLTVFASRDACVTVVWMYILESLAIIMGNRNVCWDQSWGTDIS